MARRKPNRLKHFPVSISVHKSQISEICLSKSQPGYLIDDVSQCFLAFGILHSARLLYRVLTFYGSVNEISAIKK
jgi:hypothetical protein